MPISIDPGAEVNYRLRLAENYLKDAEESFKRGGFRDTVASSQLTVENSAKAIYLFLGFQAGPTILPMSLEKLLSKYLLM